ncbi:MAG TPA: IS200/IS605 family transposase [Longimicrobium sp.]|nr:IS200/IS605 family transposase [Longimicrobium sp.]
MKPARRKSKPRMFIARRIMLRSHTELYFHLVWATVDRAPMITPELRGNVYAAIGAQSKKTATELLAVGGMPDHIHVLVRLPPTLAVAELASRLKGASSYVARRAAHGSPAFGWQRGYGAFTVSRSVVPHVRAYVLNQEHHHETNDLTPHLETTEAPPT